jgi:hypothetical protein
LKVINPPSVTILLPRGGLNIYGTDIPLLRMLF